MKKLMLLILAISLVISAFAVETFAEGISRIDCGIDIDLKKTEPDLVKKNGVIDPGEYEKFEWTGDIEIGESNLTMQWGAGGHVFWDDIVAMGKSSEWYFSWDEVNGFNFAVVITIPEAGFFTNWPQNSLDANGHIVDSFMGNVGLNIWNSTELFNQQFPGALYYSIGRDITTGAYLKGHIGTLGNRGNFDPEGGKDYVINYVGNTATFEWSIPFADFIVSDAGKNIVVEEGLKFPFSITVTAGASKPGDSGNYHDMSYGIQFGQNAWFLDQGNRDRDSAWFTVTNEYVEGVGVKETEPETTVPTAEITTVAPTQPATTEVITEYVTTQVAVTDEDGNEVTDAEGGVVTEVITDVVTSIVTEAPSESAGQDTSSPVTGDPVVIAAVVAVLAVCGVVVVLTTKRRR